MKYRSAKHFARQMLAGDRLTIAPDYTRMKAMKGWTEVILLRDENCQVALVTVQPNITVPRHRHLRVDSVDLAIAGHASRFEIDGHWGPRAMRGPLAANLVAVPAGVAHGGTAAAEGATFLTFQFWDGEPGYASDDWEPCPPLT